MANHHEKWNYIFQASKKGKSPWSSGGVKLKQQVGKHLDAPRKTNITMDKETIWRCIFY